MNQSERDIRYVEIGSSRTGIVTQVRSGVVTQIVLVQKAPALLGCCSLPGITFETGISFIRPSVIGHLGSLTEVHNKHPDAKIIVFGHTDKVGGEQPNKGLSDRRAKSAHAFITNNEEVWEQLYTKENWGVRILQMILKDFGGVYDPGTVTGSMNRETRDAIGNFQRDFAPPASGEADARTRKAIFRNYMTDKHDVTLTDADFLPMPFVGCGEFNPLIDTEDACEANRRIVFFFFAPDDAPVFPCQLESVAPCREKMAVSTPRNNALFKCSFYDRISKNCRCEQVVGTGTVSLMLKYPTGLPLDEVAYTIEVDGTVRSGTTGPDGSITEEIPSGITDVFVNVNGWRAKITIRELPAADTVSGAKIRLNNLGFHADDVVDDTVDSQYTDSLKRFQIKNALPALGSIDAPTKKKLEDGHGY